MKKTLFIAIFVLTIALVAGHFDFANGQRRGMGPVGQMVEDYLTGGNLNLTPDQFSKIMDLRQEFFSKTRGLRLDIAHHWEELQMLMHSKSPNQAKINEAVDKGSQLRMQLTIDEIKLAQEIRKLLTPQQQAIWDYSGGRMGMGCAAEFCNLSDSNLAPGARERGRARGQGSIFQDVFDD
jgi:Spy/CpxP family protein refolding chaperone